MGGTLPAAAGDFAEPRLIGSQLPELNLTPLQQQKLATLETASESQDHLLIDQVHQLRRKLSEFYEAYSLDAAAVHRTNQQLNHVQGLLLEQRLSEQMQMRRILSPIQFTQLQAAIHKHEADEDHHPDPDDSHGHEMH